MKIERGGTTITLVPTALGESVSAADIINVLDTADETIEALFVKILKIDTQAVAALAAVTLGPLQDAIAATARLVTFFCARHGSSSV